MWTWRFSSTSRIFPLLVANSLRRASRIELPGTHPTRTRVPHPTHPHTHPHTRARLSGSFWKPTEGSPRQELHGVGKEIADAQQRCMEELAKQSGLPLPNATKAPSDPLNGYLSELGICIEPTESGLLDGVKTCARASLFITSMVIDMLNFLSNNPSKGFVVLTNAEVYTLFHHPENVDFPPLYLQAHTYVLPVYNNDDPEHFFTMMLRRVKGSDELWDVEAAVFDSSPMYGWHKEQVRLELTLIVGRLAGKMGMDQGGVEKLTATQNSWECFLPRQENPSCALFHACLTLATSLGVNSSVVTPELVGFARKLLHQACLSAVDETAPNKRAIQEMHRALSAKLVHQIPTHVLPRSCRLICCCVNALVHVHPARPICTQGFAMQQKKKAVLKRLQPVLSSLMLRYLSFTSIQHVLV